MKKNHTKHIKIIPVAAGILFAALFFAGCASEPAEVSPMPALHTSLNATAEEPTAKEPEHTQLTVNSIKLAEPVLERSNRGSNTENNGIAAQYNDTIYYINNGLNSMSSSGNHQKKIFDRTDIIYVNVIDGYVYFVCSEEYAVCRMSIEAESEPENLGIEGAYSMVIMQDHIYYQNAIGNEADNYLYRANLDGTDKENLMIKASAYTFDGQVIYYANEEEENILYSYDTCTGETLQLSNNQASQINVIDGKVYYINKTTKFLTKLDLQTMESTILLEENISYLNSTGNLLVYYSNDLGLLGTMDIVSGETNQILEYNDVNGLNCAGDWIFFESYENTASNEVFYIKTDGSEISRELPVLTLAKITNYNAQQKIIYIDYVRRFTGEEAVEEYIHDFGVSERRAREVLEELGGVYIQNNNPHIIEYKFTDITDITLNINADSSYTIEGYSANVSQFEEIIEKDESLIYDQLYNIVGFDGRLIKITQDYTP